MRVAALIRLLKEMPQDAEVYTNECEATSTHEFIGKVDSVGVPNGVAGTQVFVGTGEVRKADVW